MSSISSIGNAQQELLTAFAATETDANGDSADSTDDDVYSVLETSGAGASDISTAATLLSTLSKLEKTDSSEFKTAAKKISSSLRSAAGDSTDSLSASELNTLAGLFSNAAASGSLTSLSTSASSSSSLKSYGSATSGNLISTYFASELNSSVFEDINSIVSNAITAAEET